MESKVHEMKVAQGFNKYHEQLLHIKLSIQTFNNWFFTVNQNTKKIKRCMNRNYANHCKLKKTLVRKEGVGYGAQSTWTIKDRVGQVVETASQCLGNKNI